MLMIKNGVTHDVPEHCIENFKASGWHDVNIAKKAPKRTAKPKPKPKE